MIDRTRELQRLIDAAVATQHGDGRVVIMFGEPGSGKSILVREMTAGIAPERMRVCVARAYRGDAAVPYAPWRALLADQADLRGLVPAPLGEAKPPADSLESLGRRCAARLTEFAHAHPLALIFEHLEDADESSLELIDMLAERIEGTSLLLVLTMTTATAR